MQKKILTLSLLLSPLAAVQTPGVPLSLYKISLIISLLCCIPKIFEIKSGFYRTFAIVYGLSIIPGYLMSKSPDSNTYLMSAILSLFLFLVFPNIFKRSDLHYLMKMLIRSQYIVIPFSLLGLYIYFTIGLLPLHLNLPGGFYFEFDPSSISRGNVRLILPYLTPPILSVIMSVCVVLIYFNKSMFKKRVRLSLLIIFSVIMFLTGSRSGFFGIIAFALIKITTSKFSAKSALYACVTVVIIISATVILVPEEIAHRFTERVSSANELSLEEDRHFLVPLDGIILWLSSFENFIFGIGFNSGPYMQEIHTYLPPYFLNSFVTLIAERGVLGLVLVIMLIRMVKQLYMLRHSLSDEENALIYAIITLFTGTLFYETFNHYIIMFVLSIFLTFHYYLVDRRRINNKIL